MREKSQVVSVYGGGNQVGPVFDQSSSVAVNHVDHPAWSLGAGSNVPSENGGGEQHSLTQLAKRTWSRSQNTVPLLFDQGAKDCDTMKTSTRILKPG